MPRSRSSKSSSGARRPAKAGKRSWLKRLLVAFGILGFMATLGLATGIGLMVAQIPPIEQLLAARPFGETKIYDRDGKLVASLQNGENRQLVPLTDISEHLRQAVIASEDIRFYEHHGLDIKGLGRAVTSMGKAGGGSTLTQQLAKNLFLTSDRTPTRKIADMWLAIQLERTLSKDKILEMYLNQVYFGHGAYGVEAAARKYFGKKARALNIAESAMLAGLLPAPEYYSPYRNEKLAQEIQEIVLKRMVDAGYIDAATAQKEAKRPVYFANTPDYAYRAPYFTSHVLQILTERLGQDLVMRGGLKIYTTLDLKLQETAEEIVRAGVRRYRRVNVGQGAMVAIDPATGAVRVLVGGIDYAKSQFNRAVQAKRQPGSTFKPFVYLTAFMEGSGPYTTVQDSQVSFGSYTPVNYDRRFRGAVTIERAVANSLNIPAVRVASEVGLDKVIQVAHSVGIKSELPFDLSVALGSGEVTPLELTAAYATFAADGKYFEPHLVTRVEDSHGNVIDQWPIAPQEVVEPGPVGDLHTVLQAVISYGSGRAADIGRPAAGKTGTTSENRDTWFAGYTPDLAAVVWLGNDDNSKLAAGSTGGGLAAPLWRQFMTAAHAGLPVRAFPKGRSSAAEEPIGTGELPVEASGAATPTEAVVPEQPSTAVLEIPESGVIEGQPLPEPLPTELQIPTPVNTPQPPTEPHVPEAVPSIIIIQ